MSRSQPALEDFESGFEAEDDFGVVASPDPFLAALEPAAAPASVA